jgi:hypothetical protein
MYVEWTSLTFAFTMSLVTYHSLLVTVLMKEAMQ